MRPWRRPGIQTPSRCFWIPRFALRAPRNDERYCCTTAGAAVDCAAPCRAGAVVLRVRLAGAAGLAADAVGLASLAGAAAAAGGSSGGSTVSFGIAFSMVRNLATFF